MLKLVCDKNKVPVEAYTLRHIDLKTDFPLAATVSEAGLLECCLVKKDRHSGAARRCVVRRPLST